MPRTEKQRAERLRSAASRIRGQQEEDAYWASVVKLQQQRLNRERAQKRTKTAINEQALSHLSREERSILYRMLRDVARKYHEEEDELGEQWSKLADQTAELVGRDGVDV